MRGSASRSGIFLVRRDGVSEQRALLSRCFGRLGRGGFGCGFLWCCCVGADLHRAIRKFDGERSRVARAQCIGDQRIPIAHHRIATAQGGLVAQDFQLARGGRQASTRGSRGARDGSEREIRVALDPAGLRGIEALVDPVERVALARRVLLDRAKREA